MGFDPILFNFFVFNKCNKCPSSANGVIQVVVELLEHKEQDIVANYNCIESNFEHTEIDINLYGCSSSVAECLKFMVVSIYFQNSFLITLTKVVQESR